MLSSKVLMKYAYEKDTENLVCASDVDITKDYVCISCNEPLFVKCLDEDSKRATHFCHYKHSKCTGGGLETLIHKVCKEVSRTLVGKTFIIPEISSLVMNKSLKIKNKESILVTKVEVEKTLENKLRPDVLLHYGDSCVALEFNMTHRVDASKVRRLNALGLTVVEIDLSFLLKMDDFPSEDTLREIIRNDSKHRKVICNSLLALVEKRYKDSLFYTNAEEFICPARQNTVIVNSFVCRKECPCYISTHNGIMTCTGKGCYSNIADYKNPSSRKEDRLDLVMLPSDIRDSAVVLFKQACPSCGKHMLTLGVGTRGLTFDGLLTKVSKDNDKLYKTCVSDDCNYIELLKCPSKELINPNFAGTPLKEPCVGFAKSLKKRGNGGVVKHQKGACFIGCSDSEKDSSVLSGGRLSCDSSITLFDSETDRRTLNWSEEIKATGGSLDLYFKDNKKAMKIINKIRAK